MGIYNWDTKFLEVDGSHLPEGSVRVPSKTTSTHVGSDQENERVLIIINQPLSKLLLRRLWDNTRWRCCADGGANRLYDVFESEGEDKDGSRKQYLPDLITGDLDSIRDDVREYYAFHRVPIVKDPDQDTTDLMKCFAAIEVRERRERVMDAQPQLERQAEVIILGGLTGRLDQTVHTLAYLHRLRTRRQRVFVVTEECVSWVLDTVHLSLLSFLTYALRADVFPQGVHIIAINHDLLGKTCGLLPVGVDSATLTTSGLRWNLDQQESSFGGLVSTSNHLVPEEREVRITTSRPIWWTVELRLLGSNKDI